MDEISEEHVVHVRFRDPRDKLHGVNKNYSVRLRVKKAGSKAHAESKVHMHMRRSGYVITSTKTKVVPKKAKKLKEEIELSELSDATLKSYHRQAKGEHQALSAAWRIHRKEAKNGRQGSAEWAKKLDKKVTSRDKGIRLADAKLKEENMEEDVAGMDLRKHIYASNSSGGVTIHQDAEKKVHNYFNQRHPGKPANGKFKLRLVKNEELEMDEPQRSVYRPLGDIILKVGNKVREWTDAHVKKSPDRNGNGDDVFSATGLKRASYPRGTPDPEIS